MPATRSEKTSLLLVEDEALIALATKASLERYGYVVATAGSGEAAVEAARSDKHFDLVLMDIDLGPGMDGTEAAAIILSERELPVVFLSSHAEPEVVARTEKITSYGYVVKSSNITVLDASIKMALKLFDARTLLMESEARFQDLFENMNDAFALHEVIFDDAGTAVDYRFDEANSEFAKRVGLERGQLIGHTARELFPNTEQRWIDTFGRVATTGVAEQFTEYSTELNRHYETRLYSPRLGFCAGLFRDITERKRMEEAHLAGEKRRRSLVDHTNDAIIVHTLTPDGLPGPNVEVNAQASRMLGYTREELLTLSAGDVVPGSAAASIPEHVAELLANGHATFETENRRRDGTIIPVEVSAYVYSEDDERYVVSIVRDISARKAAERELRQFRTITDSALFGCAIASVDGTLRYVNSAFAAAHGYQPEELIGKNLSVFHTEQQMQDVVAANEALKTTATTTIIELGHVHRDGTEFPMLMSGITLNDEEGNLEFFVVSAIDISDRKAAEEALRESDAQFRDLFENAPDAVFIADIETGCIVNANSAAIRLTGHPKDALVGRFHNDLHPERIRHETSAAFLRHVNENPAEAGEAVIESEIVQRDGTIVPVEVKASHVMYQGRPCLIGVFRDISDRKESEQLIRGLVREKENLLREVQHRIKNVMRTMAAMLTLQTESTHDPSGVRSLQDAASRFQSIELLYDQLYRDESHGTGSLNTFLTRLVEGVVEFFGGGPAMKIETSIVDIQLPEKTLSTVGLVINELTTNAMKYAFNGRSGGRLSVRGTVLNGTVTITVQDDGPGLPEGFDARTSGGFGLTMVHAFVEQLGGTVEFAHNGGAAVTITFPLH
ncbi:MAG: PAS domain S-box protein, partial [Spirochaetaceae bacterium]